ncbi:hypothetical protein BH10BAC5_BH10BAC5_08470 [soil metagenome]
MRKNFAIKKLYYSISEVSKITDLEQYVLRYWETEFESLKPAKNLSGNRIYTNKDIKLILFIKKCLRDEKYTIEGAKKLVKAYSEEEKDHEKSDEDMTNLKDIKAPGKHEPSLFDSGSSPSGSSNDKEESEDKDNLKKDLIEMKQLLNNLLNEL